MYHCTPTQSMNDARMLTIFLANGQVIEVRHRLSDEEIFNAFKHVDEHQYWVHLDGLDLADNPTPVRLRGESIIAYVVLSRQLIPQRGAPALIRQ